MMDLPQEFWRDIRVQAGESVEYPEDAVSAIQSSSEQEPLSFDVIVVGLGAAGAAVAARIAMQAPRLSVLGLEAGPDCPLEAEVPGLWFRLWQQGYVSMYPSDLREDAFQGLQTKRTTMIRGKVVGGTSSINGMPYLRGHPNDYDSWGIDGWKFRDVLPFFKRFEDMHDDRVLALNPEFHGVGGEMTVEAPRGADPLKDVIKAAAEELGQPEVIDFNGPGAMGFGETHRTQRDGLRCGSAKAFLSKAGPGGKAANLSLARNCTVTKLSIDLDKKRATGVHMNAAGKPCYVQVTREVILCAGAMETPKILLLSGVGPKEHLADVGIPLVADLPVGSVLQDHALFPGVIFSIPPQPKNNADSLESFTKAAERSGPLASIGLMELMGFIDTPSTRDWKVPSVQFNHVRYPKGHFQSRNMSPDFEAAIKRLNESTDILAIMPFLLHPKLPGELRLRSSDPNAPPRYRSGLLLHPQDEQILLEGIRFVERMSQTKSFRDNGITQRYVEYPGSEGLVPGSDAYWKLALKQLTGSAYHPVATCALGSVVDERLNVKGVHGVRVGDAAAIPSPLSANPNAPAIMIGERAAQFVIEDLHG